MGSILLISHIRASFADQPDSELLVMLCEYNLSIFEEVTMEEGIKYFV